MKTAHGWRNISWLVLLALVVWVFTGIAQAFDFTQRTISKSGQFIVYSSEIQLRLAVSSYAETAKQDVLETLGMGDHWKFPIVIDLRRPASTDTGGLVRDTRLVQTDDGWKVQVSVLLREGELKQVRFPQLMIQAILLELAYRDNPPQIGTNYAQPPSWLVEALAQSMQTKASGQEPNAALFRQMIETGRLPSIRDFLKSNVEAMDPTSLSVHDFCCSSLLDQLATIPGGNQNLARMVKGIPEFDNDPVALLLKHFPSLGGNEVSLEKWWTLGLARFSTMDRHLALSLSETDARLTPLLKLTIAVDKKKEQKKEFDLSQYKEFIKLADAKMALLGQSQNFALLQVQAHPLLRPVLVEYQRITMALARGKTRGADKDLSEVANYRALIVDRMDKIDDYLNWYEATQMPQQSGAFDDFLQGAKAMENWTPPKRNDPVSRYIDQLEREFE